MAYSITKSLDGDISLGNLRAEKATLQPSVSDYATNGYLVQGIGGATESTGNVGIDKVLFVIPCGGQGGYFPVFNPTTSKVRIFQCAGSAAPGSEVSANTDLSAYAFDLLIVGF